MHLVLPKLTNRENDILEQIAHGYTNREISSNLSISESTVENHIHNIYLKLGISRRAQAILYAVQSRLTPPQNDTKRYGGNPS